MLVLDLVNQVVLEGLHDEVFIVHKEDVFGNRDGLIAIVDGGGGVKKLHTLTVALVLGRWVLDEGVLQKTVQWTGANDILGVIPNPGDRFEDVLDGVPFHSRNANEWGVVEEEELAAEMIFGCFEACRLLPFRVKEVKLVGDNEAGLFLLMN